jgi:hypothetical protein
VSSRKPIPDDAPNGNSKSVDSSREKEPYSRITLIEALIAVAIIVALCAWLPKEWNR